MNVEDFVTNTLIQITNGAKKASNSDFKFDLDSNTSKGVHFNLAVINTEKEEKKGGGKGGVNIKVISADYGKQNSKIVGAETISRIEFNITHQDLENGRESAESYRTFNRNP